MLKLRETALRHEDLFMERYEQLLAWALQLTENNRERAEDLLHDAFIQFTLGRPDLAAIVNLEGYLRTMLRNINVSQIRRSSRNPLRSLSIVEYDSAELGLRLIDPRSQLSFQEDLQTICEYACMRKESSKAGSILILRFFHGYFPEEISQVARISRPAVKERLRLARAEARTCLDNPNALSFLRQGQASQPNAAAVTSGDFMADIRSQIFRSRNGVCLSEAEARRLYTDEKSSPIDCEKLAHIVSCQQCLDLANKLLGLPPLSARYALENVGKDSRRKNDGPGGKGPRGGGGSVGGKLGKYLLRAKEVFEHEPQELFVSVNGHLLASQKVSSEVTEQTLSIKGEEKIGFIEVFSEQEIRLVLLNVDALPDGPIRQATNFTFAEGRSLGLSLNFSGPWPELQVVYRDPNLASPKRESVEETAERSDHVVEPEPTISAQQDEKSIVKAVSVWLRRRTFSWNTLLSPQSITAVIALILVAIFLLVNLRRAPVDLVRPAALLSEAALAEDRTQTRTDVVFHRIINLSETDRNGTLIARRRIEVWQSAVRGLSARRLYDDRGQLISGDWRNSNGVQTLYQHGQQPKLQTSPDKRSAHSINFENVWELSPSAKEFMSLVGDSGIEVHETQTTYTLSSSKPRNAAGLVAATLVLRRPDLHAAKELLVVQQGGDLRQYEFEEVAFEHHAPDTIAPRVFEPERELLVTGANNHAPESAKTTSQPTEPATSNPAVASPEFEVEVTYLLDQVRANLGEQVNLSRMPNGQLQIKGIVETESRRSEILQALASVINNAALHIDIQTVEEALKRQKEAISQAAVAGTLTAKEGVSLPLESELRRYFASSGISDERLDQRVREFSNEMIARARQSMRHAYALKRLIEQFNEDQLKTLGPDARAKRSSMITSHAEAFERETRQLRTELEKVFASAASASGVAEGNVNPIDSEPELARAVRQLFEFANNTERAVGATFAISSENSIGSPIQNPQFWQSLRSAERLAGRIKEAQLQ